MKRFTQIVVVLLEVFALVLAHLQGLGGVRTDEAKYLLSIPYPHPPFMRSIMAATEILPFQEWLWRAIFASLLIQAVWLVWHMGKRLPHTERFAVAVTWIFSATMIIQAGTIMLAVVTGLQALVFVWLLYCNGQWKMDNEQWSAKGFLKRIVHYPLSIVRYVRGSTDQEKKEWKAFWVAVFWTASLFTAYQIVLFVPLVIAVFASLPVSKAKRVFYFVAPVIALGLYTAGSPLVIASFAIQGSKDAADSILMRFMHVGWLWVMAGSVFGAVLGIVGIFRSKSWALVLTFILMSLAMFMAWQQYYAILFSPLLVAGLLHFFHHTKLKGFPYTPVLVFATVVLVGLRPPWSDISTSRAVMSIIDREVTQSGSLMMYGYFGHDWQYESRRFPVRKYHATGFRDAVALVCTSNCDAIRKEGMSLATDHPVEVWLRQ